MKVNQMIMIVLCSVALAIHQHPCLAQTATHFTKDLDDAYLKKNCNWAMYVSSQKVEDYLNYSGSQLHELSKVSVYFRSFSRLSGEGENKPSRLYEELWYHKGVAVGLNIRDKLNLENDTIGIIVIANDPVNTAGSGFALTSTLVRLVLDLQFQQSSISAVMVPESKYAEIAASLGHYHFFNQVTEREGAQMSLRLVSYPGGAKDENFYYTR